MHPGATRCARQWPKVRPKHGPSTAATDLLSQVKTEFLRILLAAGHDVLISDLDIAWLGNPWPEIRNRINQSIHPSFDHPTNERECMHIYVALLRRSPCWVLTRGARG